MGETIAHRGPDDAGTWIEPDIGLVLSHQRLSIIDLSPEGHQPMVSASGRWVIAFNGDVYEGLDAPSLNQRQLEYAQSHIRILSGLYGVLRPLDLMQPYRLEMGTRLANPQVKDLYAFWGESVTRALNSLLSAQRA